MRNPRPMRSVLLMGLVENALNSRDQKLARLLHRGAVTAGSTGGNTERTLSELFFDVLRR